MFFEEYAALASNPCLPIAEWYDDPIEDQMPVIRSSLPFPFVERLSCDPQILSGFAGIHCLVLRLWFQENNERDKQPPSSFLHAIGRPCVARDVATSIGNWTLAIRVQYVVRPVVEYLLQNVTGRGCHSFTERDSTHHANIPWVTISKMPKVSSDDSDHFPRVSESIASEPARLNLIVNDTRSDTQLDGRLLDREHA